MKIRTRLAILLLTTTVAAPAYAQPDGCHLAFDGTDDRVEIADSAFPLFEYTLSAWVQTSSSTGVQAALSRGEDDPTDILPWGFGTLNGLVYLQIENAANTSSTAYSGVTTVGDGSWRHIAATRALDGTVKLYVDGLLDAMHLTPDTTSSSQTVCMGCSYQDIGSGPSTKPPLVFWHGSLDELSLWSVALGDSAIADLAENGVPASPTGLVAYWNLDEGTGQTAADTASGGSHPGTLGATGGADASDPRWVCAAVPALAPTGLVALALALLLAAAGVRRAARVG
jgi:hypothetical protein